MTQHNSLNVKLSNSQLNKLKSAIKIETVIVLRLSSNMIGNSDDEINFLVDKSQIFVKVLLTTHQLISSYQKPSYLK